MAHIVLPDGKTVGQLMRPQIITAYDTGKMPPLLGYDHDPSAAEARLERVGRE